MALKLILEENRVVVLQGNPKIDNYIDRVTRFQASGYERTDTYKKGEWDGYTRLYDFKAKSFPLGLLEDVEMMLQLKDIQYEIVDNRVFKRFSKMALTHNINLRDYQKIAVEKAIERKRCLIQLPTGAGKTLVGIYITGLLKTPTVFYVHKKELLYQTARAYRACLTFPQCEECPARDNKATGECDDKRCVLGLIGDGHSNIRPITIAMIQSAHLLPKELFTDFGIAIVDECLHKDTQISLPDSKYATIKEIYENPNITHVLSFNETSQTVETKKILRKIRQPMPPDQRWREITIKYNTADISARRTRLLITPNHKLWTPTGWKRADEIIPGDKIKWLMNNPTKIYQCNECPTSYATNYALAGHKNSAHLRQAENNAHLRNLNQQFNPFKNKTIHHKAMIKRSQNLEYRHKLSARMRHKNPSFNPETREKIQKSMQKVWSDPAKLQERLRNYQNAPLRGRGYDHRNPTILEQAIIEMHLPGLIYTGNGSLWLTMNGKHKNPDFVLSGEHKAVEVGDTEYWHDQDEITQTVENYNTIGWKCLYLTDKDLKTPEDAKSRLVKFLYNHEATVINTRWCHGRSRGRAFRYNLEIEDTHNYFANGILVSNCHHMPADTVWDIAKDTKTEYLIGLSATIRREDGKEMLIQAGAGPIAHSISTSELIRRKILAKPHIHAIQVAPVMFSRKDRYPDVYQKAVVSNQERNEKIALKAVELSETGPVYIHVKRIDHGEMLTNIINKKLLVKGLTQAVFIHGDDASTYRNQVLDNFRKDKLPILVSTLLGEGVDLPNMYALILASGGLSRTFVIQIFGRLLRMSRHEIVVFYDVADSCKYLYEHFLARVSFYQSEEEFVLEEYLKNMKVE